MLVRSSWLIVAFVSFCVCAGELNGQTRSTNGLFGQTNVGSGAATNTGRSTSTTNPSLSSTGGSTGGSSGGSAGGSNVQQPDTTNVAAGAASQNVAAQITTQQTAGSFAGADAADTQNFLSRQTGAVRTTNNLSGLQNLFSQSLQQLNQQTQRSTRPQIRVPLRLGFQPAPVSQTHVRKFETRLARLPGIRFISAPEVVLEGRTAILRGVVASEDDRRLAEALAKMEPEILAVKNELTVETSATTAEPLPAIPNSP